MSRPKSPRFALAALAGLLATTAPALPARATTDILGRTVPEDDGRPAVELYVNKESRKRLRKEAFELAWALREANPKVIVRVDLRDVPGFLQGIAHGKVRSAWRDSLRDMTALFRDHGEEPPARLAESLYMVADDEGEAHRALGLGKHAAVPWARVVGPDGAPWEQGPFPEAAERIQEAVEERCGRTNGSPQATEVTAAEKDEESRVEATTARSPR